MRQNPDPHLLRKSAEALGEATAAFREALDAHPAECDCHRCLVLAGLHQMATAILFAAEELLTKAGAPGRRPAWPIVPSAN